MRSDDGHDGAHGGRGGGWRTGRIGVPVGIGLLLILFAGYFFGIAPPRMQDGAGPARPAPLAAAAGQGVIGAPQDPAHQFASRVFSETTDVWAGKIAELGGRYPPPKLELFTGQVDSACGLQSAASGPFYCPGDQRVYIDLAFLGALEARAGEPGEFARAYVLAHTVGHHVQALLGATEAVQKVRQRSAPEVVKRALLAMELQADCYAGIWAKEALGLHQGRGLKSFVVAADIDAVLLAAKAVGDDTVRRAMQGRVIPETFSHGSPAQRSAWFRRGFDSGQIQGCDTFNSPSL